MKLTNTTAVEKYVKEFIVPEIKTFMHEDSVPDVAKRLQIINFVREMAKDGHMEFLHGEMIPLYRELFYPTSEIYRAGNHHRLDVLHIIISYDPSFGEWAKGEDLLKAAEHWGECLLESGKEGTDFLWMMERMLATGYETEWGYLAMEVRDRLQMEEVYGNHRSSEVLSILYGASMIYGLHNFSKEQKKKMFDVFCFNWSYLKHIYSVMFRCVVGCRLKNMAGIANTVTLTQDYYPYLHLFYCALKGRIEDFCIKKGDREKLEKQLGRIENLMRSTSPSSDLDELYKILFPDEFQHYLNTHRPKDYKQLKNEFECFKKEMNERVAQMNSQILGMAEQLRTMASASVPISVIADELLQLSPGIAWEVFVQLNGMLIENEAWLKHAGEIRKRIRNKQEKPQPNVQATNYYAPGSTHNDDSKHISLTNDKKQIGQA